MYKDRNGNTHNNDATPTGMISFMYNTLPGRLLLKLTTRPWVSNVVRAYMRSSISGLHIYPFIKKNNVDLSEYESATYHCFNDFFIRKIRAAYRPVVEDPGLLAAPCDSHVSVFRIEDGLVLDIKSSHYTVASLLRHDELAREFRDGWCIVMRLTVDNYHRYSYPDNGVKTGDVFVPGVLHTVSPVALEKLQVFVENQRVYTVIDTENFGKMVQMEVGAVCVGRIVNHHGPGPVRRGEEKGYFEFGGSTVVLLLDGKHFTPDTDLIENTEDGFETIIKMGERIGYNEKYQG